MDSLNWLCISLITLGSFFGGALWYSPVLFGNIWMRIHHGETPPSPEAMKELSRGMWKILIVELMVTFVMIMTLDFMISILPAFSGIHTAFMVWMGFVFPTYVSATIWWGDKRNYMLPKILISGAYRLLVLLIAGQVLSMWAMRV